MTTFSRDAGLWFRACCCSWKRMNDGGGGGDDALMKTIDWQKQSRKHYYRRSLAHDGISTDRILHWRCSPVGLSRIWGSEHIFYRRTHHPWYHPCFRHLKFGAKCRGLKRSRFSILVMVTRWHISWRNSRNSYSIIHLWHFRGLLKTFEGHFPTK